MEPHTRRGRAPPPGFRCARVLIDPGAERAHDDREWLGALVVLTRGQVELVTRAGARRRFERGAVLWLTGLSLRLLYNPGTEPAELTVVRRRDPGAADP